MAKEEKVSARARLSTTSRVVAGTLGAYGLTALITMALSLVLSAFGMNRVEAVTAATLVSFAVFAGLSMFSFHARSVTRLWAGMLLTAAPLAVLIWLLRPMP